MQLIIRIRHWRHVFCLFWSICRIEETLSSCTTAAQSIPHGQRRLFCKQKTLILWCPSLPKVQIWTLWSFCKWRHRRHVVETIALVSHDTAHRANVLCVVCRFAWHVWRFLPLLLLENNSPCTVLFLHSHNQVCCKWCHHRHVVETIRIWPLNYHLSHQLQQ